MYRVDETEPRKYTSVQILKFSQINSTGAMIQGVSYYYDKFVLMSYAVLMKDF